MIKNSELATENRRLKDQSAKGDEYEELDKKYQDLKQENQRLNEQSARNDEYDELAKKHQDLKQENQRLRSQPTRDDKYDELTKKYQDLEQQIKYLRRKNNDVMQKNKDMKESVRSWQEYCDRQAAKQKSKDESKAGQGHVRLSAIPHIDEMRPHMPSSPISIATVCTPLLHADQSRSSPSPMPLLGRSADDMANVREPRKSNGSHETETEDESVLITPKPLVPNRSLDDRRLDMSNLPSGTSSRTMPNEHIRRRTHSSLQAATPSSSQTTVEETGEPSTSVSQLDAVADEDDVPQFVSARSVNKRKRGQTSRIEVYGDRSDGTPIKPFRVKEEPGSSPPNAYSLRRKDTVDLDAPGSRMLQTPHHPRHQRSSSAPFSQRIVRDKEPELPLALGESAFSDVDVRAYSEPSDALADLRDDVLKDLDPNIFAEPHDNLPNKRVKVSHAHGQTAHSILSESGEELPPMDENELRLPPSAARKRLNRNLHGPKGAQIRSLASHHAALPARTEIKAEPHPASSPRSLRSMQTPVVKAQSRDLANTPRLKPSSNPTTVDRPQWQMKAPEPRRSVRKPIAPLPQKQKRLRTRPVEKLKPADFKVNPAYNQGYSYAFSETVRKRGDRTCLPGCTNLQCCGSKFRAFAQAQAPLPASQEDALLEDYFGEAYDNMNLTQMASDEREELVLQARTKKMAKDAGKHREAYERRPSPPGFWRVDFPSTQELEEDRKKAKELEKALVRERWLEAQRKGGKWIFRDE